MMRTQIFELRSPRGVGGLSGALMLAVGVVLVLGLLALLLFVGAAVVVVALAVSAGVALWHGLRRKLGQGQAPGQPLFNEAPRSAATYHAPHSGLGTTLTEAREIEVEVLPKRDDG